MGPNTDDFIPVKKNTLKYLFPLILFLAVYPAFIIYEVHFIFQIAFIIGLLFFTYNYDKLEKELNEAKMKNHYVKSKIGLKINELDKTLESSKREYSIKLLQSIIDDFN